MKKMPRFLIWTGFAVAVLGLANLLLGPRSHGLLPNLGASIYTAVFAGIIGTLVGLVQLGILIAGRYRGQYKLLIPEAILLGLFLFFGMPGVLRARDVFLPIPSTLAEATKQINACQVVGLFSPKWSQGSSDMSFMYKSGRRVTFNGQLWPGIRDMALKDANHCGYQGAGSADGSIPEAVLLTKF